MALDFPSPDSPVVRHSRIPGLRSSTGACIGLLMLAILTVACGSTASETATGPTPPKCGVTLAAPAAVTASGGTGKVAITTDPECAWTATAEVGWITEVTPRNGQGSGELQFRVSPNPDGVARQGAIAVNDHRAMVRQDAAECSFTLDPSQEQFTANGGDATVAVSAPAGCAWTATTTVSWILINSPSGTGNGTVGFRVTPNAGSARQGTITLAGQAVDIRQDGVQGDSIPNPRPGEPPSCTVSLQPTAASMPASGGPGVITVSALPDCAWSVSTGASWITTSPTSGRGSATVTFVVAPNSGGARAGTLEIAGTPFTIHQAGNTNPVCTITLDPLNRSVAASGVTGATITVSVAAGCSWSAASNNSWITITAGASGAGSGTVRFNVAANSGGARTGTLTVGGQTVTVSQAGTCTYAIAPSTFSTSAGAASGPPVTVTTSSTCSWTAVSNAGWLTITSGATGTGNGTASFSVAANTGAARTGTLTIAGQTFTVTQAGSCTYTIAPASHTVGSAGGSSSVSVSTATGCAWTATSDSGWVTITAGASGSGNGTVAFTVAANSGATRTARLTIAGQTFSVTQQAQSCSYSITPTSQTIGDAGGAGDPVTVSTGDGCAWTATSNAGWLTVTSGASGTGRGTVTFNVASFTGSSRTGTLTIAGQTLTVRQVRCDASLSPTKQSVNGVGGVFTLSVSMPDGCSWNARSDSSWIVITLGATGSGNGTVTYLVLPNASGKRTGRITVDDQTLTVEQAPLMGDDDDD